MSLEMCVGERVGGIGLHSTQSNPCPIRNLFPSTRGLRSRRPRVDPTVGGTSGPRATFTKSLSGDVRPMTDPVSRAIVNNLESRLAKRLSSDKREC